MKVFSVLTAATVLGLAAAEHIPTLALQVATYEDNKCEKLLKDVTVTFNQAQTKWGGGLCETIDLQQGLGQFKSFKILTKENPHPRYYDDETTTVNAFYGFYGQECDPSTYLSKQTFTKKDRGSCTESVWVQHVKNQTYHIGAGSLKLNSYNPEA